MLTPLADVVRLQIPVTLDGLGPAQVLPGRDGLAGGAGLVAGRGFAGDGASDLRPLHVGGFAGKDLGRGGGGVGGEGASDGLAVHGDGNAGFQVLGGQLGRFGRRQAPAVKS